MYVIFCERVSQEEWLKSLLLEVVKNGDYTEFDFIIMVLLSNHSINFLSNYYFIDDLEIGTHYKG